MSIKAIKRLSGLWFTPEDQKGEDKPARFKIQPLNGLQHAEIISELRSDGRDYHLTYTGIQSALKNGLIDWENIEDEEGKPLSFKPSNLRCIPGNYLHEIAGEIIGLSNISEDDAKKPD